MRRECGPRWGLDCPPFVCGHSTAVLGVDIAALEARVAKPEHSMMEKSKSVRRFQKENEERLNTEKQLVDRRRNLLVLALEYLRAARLNVTFEALEREAGIACSHFAPAEGIDLVHVLNEFEAYHQIKHNRPPAYFNTAKGASGGGGGGVGGSGKKNGKGAAGERGNSASSASPSGNGDAEAPRKSLRELREEAKQTPVFHQPNRPKPKPADAGGSGGGAGTDDDPTAGAAGGLVLSVGPASTANEEARARRQRRMSYNPPQMPAGLGVPLVLKGRAGGSISGAAGAALPGRGGGWVGCGGGPLACACQPGWRWAVGIVEV